MITAQARERGEVPSPEQDRMAPTAAVGRDDDSGRIERVLRCARGIDDSRDMVRAKARQVADQFNEILDTFVWQKVIAFGQQNS